MDTSRAAAMAAILATEERRPPPAAMPPVEAQPYTIEGAMDRARRFVAPAGSEPSRKYLEGVFVSKGRAWATNARSAAQLPLVGGVPNGLHLYGTGWAEKAHDFPDLDKIIAGLGVSAKTLIPVSVRHLRALAEHVVACAPSTPPNDHGYPCAAVTIHRRPRQLAAGSALLASENEGSPCRPPSRLGDTQDEGEAAAVVYDARYIIPALIGAGDVVGLSMAPGRFSPLLIARCDGEAHVIMPLRQNAV